MKLQTILLIEDQQEARRAGRRLLEDCGFFVLTANSGREGLRLFRKLADEILAVIVSRTLFDMDGEDILDEILQYRPAARVILSGEQPEDETAENLRAKGLAGYLTKPFDEQAVLEVIREVLA